MSDLAPPKSTENVSGAEALYVHVTDLYDHSNAVPGQAGIALL